jgi:hypothetical protein
MTLKISASSLFKNHYLKLDSGGVKFYESAAIGGAKRFRFSEILCILMSPDNTLSFQVGQEVFSIKTNPANTKHQTVINTLNQEVQRANGLPA